MSKFSCYSVSAVDGCCSVLALPRLAEKEAIKKNRKKKAKQKNGNQKWESGRLFSLRCMVFPPNAVLLMSSSLSKQDQDDWLESIETQNEKLEHQVPPTGYSHTDTCRNCMQSTVITSRLFIRELLNYTASWEHQKINTNW